MTPQRFAAAMATWADEDPRRRGYARDVAAIYSGYAARLEELGRVDGELYAWRALDALRAAPTRWGAEPVFFYGFDDLHPLERDAIETLARIVGADVTVSLTYEAGRVALQARAEVVEELRPLAERVIELPASASTTTRVRGPHSTTSSASCSNRSPSGSTQAARSRCSRPGASGPRPS